MRLLDLQVSYQALPEQARLQGMEHAAGAYRQVAAMALARQENLERPEKVIQAASTTSASMAAIDPREKRMHSQQQPSKSSREVETFIDNERGIKRKPPTPVGSKLDLFI